MLTHQRTTHGCAGHPTNPRSSSISCHPPPKGADQGLYRYAPLPAPHGSTLPHATTRSIQHATQSARLCSTASSRTTPLPATHGSLRPCSVPQLKPRTIDTVRCTCPVHAVSVETRRPCSVPRTIFDTVHALAQCMQSIRQLNHARAVGLESYMQTDVAVDGITQHSHARRVAGTAARASVMRHYRPVPRISDLHGDARQAP